MRTILAFIIAATAFAQTAVDKTIEAQLKKVFPAATSFSPKQTKPVPHYVAYSGAGASQSIAGYVFWTTELEPLERAYDGPIKILVGMNTNATLTGILVTEHHEPYGYFSVDLPEFAGQFRGKSIADPFKVGSDVNAISRASISVTSSSRAIRNGSRRVARALLTPPGTTK